MPGLAVGGSSRAWREPSGETRAYIGSIAKTLKLQTGKTAVNLVTLTQPDGAAVKIDPGQVTAIRAALPGEYDWSVKSVLTLAKHQQQASARMSRSRRPPSGRPAKSI